MTSLRHSPFVQPEANSKLAYIHWLALATRDLFGSSQQAMRVPRRTQ
ncbi:MAG: hypothetical protein OXL38_23115 [Gammaproteobacteria bacterium]|nr:hypothetical protein [Gammaproteobacteria bacterium]